MGSDSNQHQDPPGAGIPVDGLVQRLTAATKLQPDRIQPPRGTAEKIMAALHQQYPEKTPQELEPLFLAEFAKWTLRR